MLVFPQLHTPRLTLRKLTVDDIPSLVKYADNRNISDYILNIPYPYREPDAVFRLSYIHQGFTAKSRFIFAIILKNNNECIGEISIHLDDKTSGGQIAYWIGESHWNNGYATEAIRSVLNFGFERLHLDIIYATVDEENNASIKVLEHNNLNKTGYTGKILRYSIRNENTPTHKISK